MPYSATVYKIMIASPGDVAPERRIAKDIVHEWNAVHSQDRGTVLTPIAWETNTSPAMGERGQEIINKQIVRDADLLVAIFWTRLGTPTGVAASGTVEEIEEHLRKNKPAMLYFSSAPVRLDSVDENQFRALKEFKETCRRRGLVEEYESISEFREKFWRQLAQTVIRNFPAATQPTRSDTPIVDSSGSEISSSQLGLAGIISKEARELLKEIANDTNGTVIAVEALGGMSVETNGRNFVETGDPRSEAQWKRVLQELVQHSLLQQRDQNGEVFSITDAGYRLVDLLR